MNKIKRGCLIAVAMVVASVVIAVSMGAIATCVWFLALYCIYRHGGKEMAEAAEIDKKLDILTKECDPAGYIQVMTEWQKANPKKAAKQEMIRANLGVAYFCDGQYEIALDMLEEVYRKTGQRNSIREHAAACSSLAVFYFQMDEEEKSRFYFNQLLQLREKLKNYADISYLVSQSIRDLEMQREIKEGQISKAMEYYTEQFHKNPYGKPGVHFQYRLFRIYEIKGDEESQESAMNYISKHGGTTVYAAEAREWLKNRHV